MGDSLKGRVAVVTGSGQGIGRAIALAFAAEGAKVITNNRKPGSTGNTMVSEEQLKKMSDEQQAWYNKSHEAENGDAATTAQTIRDNGGEATPVFCDITKMEDAEKLIKTAVDTYGRIDILCNVAGSFGFADIEDITDELWDRVNGVKPRGYFHTMKFAIPYMRAQKYGRIINCASPAFTGGPLKHAEYCAANAGVIGLTRAAAFELSIDGITVNAFSPAALTRASYELEAAKMTQDKGIIIKGRKFVELEDTMGPEYVAPFVTYLASERASRINGSNFMLSGNLVGMYANPVFEKALNKDPATPWSLDELIAKVEEEILPTYKSILD